MKTAVPSAADPDAVDTRRLRIFRNFRSVFLGRIFSSFSMWLALIVLAKLSDPMTVGIYAFAQAVCIPIAEVARMGMREVQSSDTAGVWRFGVYLALRLLAAGVALGLMLASGLLQSQSTMVLWVVSLYAVTRCLELVSDMVHGLFQSQERMEYIGRSLCLLGPLSLLFLSVGYWATGSLVVAVLGQLLAQLLVLALYDIPVGRRQGSDDSFPIWDTSALRGLALKCLPLAVATALVMIAVYLPRLAVERSLGLSSLGLFSALTALAMAPTRLVSTMGVAVSVRVAQYHAAGQRRLFLGILGRFVFVVAVCGAAFIAITARFGDAIVGLIYTSAYSDQGYLLTLLVTAATLRCIADVLKFGIIASRRFWWLSAQYGVVAMVAALSCLTLIPMLGLIGAGISMLMIFSSQLVVALLGILYNLPRLALQKENR